MSAESVEQGAESGKQRAEVALRPEVGGQMSGGRRGAIESEMGEWEMEAGGREQAAGGTRRVR